MGARCVDSLRGTTIKSGTGATLFPREAFIHTSAFYDVRRAGTATQPQGEMPCGGEGSSKKSPDLAEPPKAADDDCNNTL